MKIILEIKDIEQKLKRNGFKKNNKYIFINYGWGSVKVLPS